MNLESKRPPRPLFGVGRGDDAGRFLIGLMPRKTEPSAIILTTRCVCIGFCTRLRNGWDASSKPSRASE
jgi:hypothetical protein